MLQDFRAFLEGISSNEDNVLSEEKALGFCKSFSSQQQLGGDLEAEQIWTLLDRTNEQVRRKKVPAKADVESFIKKRVLTEDGISDFGPAPPAQPRSAPTHAPA